MLKFRLDFFINEGEMNTFLVGSKSLFEKVKLYENLLSKSINVEISVEYKMIELEHKRISYDVVVEIEYPLQMLLGVSLTKEQIDSWFSFGCSLLFASERAEVIVEKLSSFANEIGLNKNLLYVDLPVKKIENSLEDLKKLSILLFRKLEFREI